MTMSYVDLDGKCTRLVIFYTTGGGGGEISLDVKLLKLFVMLMSFVFYTSPVQNFLYEYNSFEK